MSELDPALQEWVERFVASELTPAAVDKWSARTTEVILAETPEIMDDAVLVQALSETVRAHWSAFLSHLSQPDRDFTLVPEAAKFAAEVALRGLHLVSLFRVYRLGQQAVWQYATQVLKEHPIVANDDETGSEVLVFFWGRASWWLDSSIEASVDVYQVERDRIVRGANARQLDVVREALEGRIQDVRRFSAAVGGYPLSGYNTAFIVRTDDPNHVAELENAATKIVRTLGSRQPLIVALGGRELWCWAATRVAPDLSTVTTDDAWCKERQITVSIGTPSTGLDGFVLSHKEARTADQIASAFTEREPISTYSSVEILAMMHASDEQARRFTLRTLRRLAESTESAERLRNTVQSVLSRGSVEAAATELFIHKNTVRYRLSQAENMLGFPVTTSPTEVDIALRYFATFMEGEQSGS